MKRKIFGMVAILMIGATTMAQNTNSDKTEIIQKRTENVAKKYGLDETQTKKLLELNTKYADAITPDFGARGNRPGGRAMRPRGREGMDARPMRPDSTARPRMQLTDEQKAQFAEKRKEMEKQREEYEKELQTIMTEDQYKQYKADAAKRMPNRQRKQQD